jgi:predicted esterase
MPRSMIQSFAGVLVFLPSLGLNALWAHDYIEAMEHESSSMPEANIPTISALDLGLARAERIQSAIDATLNEHEYGKAAELFDKYLGERKHGPVEDWIIASVAHAHLGNIDQAIMYLDEAVKHGLELDSTKLEKTLASWGAMQYLAGAPRYLAFLQNLDRLKISWNAELDPSLYGVAEPNIARLNELRDIAERVEPLDFLNQITEFNDYPEPSRRDGWVRYEMHANADLPAPYYVYIPPQYDHRKPSGLIVYLHGDTSQIAPAPSPESKDFIASNPFFDFARRNNLLILFPSRSRRIVWWEPLGIRTLHRQLYSVKRIFNVDDSSVWLSGHSIGGTGAFGIACTAPTMFAGFYLLNAMPIPDRLANLHHRPVYSIFSSKDKFIPIGQASSIWQAACRNNANWLFRELPGHGHSYYSYIEEELNNLTSHMLSTHRPPLPAQIAWEASPIEMSGCDWLRVERVTPGKNRAAWHGDSTETIPAVDLQANQRSTPASAGNDLGKIRARSGSNIFRIEASQVGEFSIRLSHQMVDFRYPIKVYVNGKLVRDEMVSMDPEVMLAQFEREGDRQRVWSNILRIVIPS